jgi:uncharacterized OB-fold protein
MGLEDAIEVPPVLARPRLDASAQALVGSRCQTCAATAWPSRAVCHACGSTKVQMQRFARSGELLSLTQVHIGRPGHPAPYLLGQVRIDMGGPEIFGRVEGVPIETPLPADVNVSVGPGTDNQETYWFSAIRRT